MKNKYLLHQEIYFLRQLKQYYILSPENIISDPKLTISFRIVFQSFNF